MPTVRKPSATRIGNRADMRRIRNLTEELSREEHGLGMRLLDAAVAGVILGLGSRYASAGARMLGKAEAAAQSASDERR